MKLTTLRILALALMLACFKLTAIAQMTQPTRWAAEAQKATTPLNQYPRPQMARAEWQNLNGDWLYMGGKELANPRTTTREPAFAKAAYIKVPFAPESDLSGIRKKDETNMWYRRSFTIPETWNGKDVLLNFGAVDRFCRVFVNGKGLFVRGHLWPVRNAAYEMKASKTDLTNSYVLMMNEVEQMCKYYGLSTAIYSQTTDVEHEINGLVTYDREVEKMDLDRVKEINQAVIESTRQRP